MNRVDYLAAALALGDPGETVPTDVLNTMAAAAVDAGWVRFAPPERMLTAEQTAQIMDSLCPDCGGLSPRDEACCDGNCHCHQIVTDPMFPVPEGPDDGR